MKNFKAEIYQLDKDGNTSFKYDIKGETANDTKIDGPALGAFFSEKIFAILDKQNTIKDNGGKAAFFGLLKGKPLNFYFKSDTMQFNTELANSITAKSIKLSGFTPESLSQAVATLYEVINEKHKI